MWSWLSPIAPVYLGCFYLRPRADWQLGAFGILASAVLAGMVLLSIRNSRLWIVALTHFAVAFYWVVGFVLIAAGV